MTTTTLPRFGLIQVETPEGTQPVGCLGQNTHEQLDDLTPAALRQLAVDASAAADWIEANR